MKMMIWYDQHVMKNDEHTYEEEQKLASDRDLFDKCCLSCCAADAFYDIDLIPEEEEKENAWTLS